MQENLSIKSKKAKQNFAKTASLLYIIWGVLHLYSAKQVLTLGQSLEPGMVQGRIFQDAWNLMFFALFGIVVGLVLVWKNDILGYWLNLIVVSIGDIGFILTILMPGYIDIWPGALGPILWILAAIFSTIARFKLETS
jgi:hypothetical protein